MKERKTLNEVYSLHKDTIQIAIIVIIVIIVIALFIGGYLVSWNFMEKPLNDSQFELYEQVVRDVYAQKGNVIVEVPEGVYVSMTTTTITVESTNNLYRGKVIAKLQNGELVMMRDMETEEAVASSILIGIFFVLVTFLIVLSACKIYMQIKKKSGK